MSLAALTLLRQTRLKCDLDQTVCLAEPFAMFRAGSEIARGNLNPKASSNVARMANGAIILQPFQDRTDYLHERTDGQNAIIRASSFSLATGMVERDTFRAPSDLTGVTVSANVSTTGADPYIVKTVNAGTTWAASLTSDIAGYGQVIGNTTSTAWAQIYSTPNYDIDRLAVGKVQYPDNQAFELHFISPSKNFLHITDLLMVFYFGEPLNDAGDGAYALAFFAFGEVFLIERVNTAKTSPAQVQPVLRDQWKFSPLLQGNGGVGVSMRIHPYFTPSGAGRIEFTAGVGHSVPNAASNVLNTAFYNPSAPTRHTYHVSRSQPDKAIDPNSSGASGRADAAPTAVTGHGTVRVDMPRPERIPFQVSVLKGPTSGYVTDNAFTIPGYQFLPGELTLIWETYLPAGSSVRGELYDATTKTTLAATATTSFSATYTPNDQQSSYYAKFTLTSDGTNTPILYRYRVLRDARFDDISPGLFSLPDDYPTTAIRSVNISGPENDPSHESASLTVEDPGGTLAAFAARANMRQQVTTQYSSNTNLRSVLFDGFMMRADGTRKGSTANEGLGSAGRNAARLFPSPLWREFELTLTGMWTKLHQALAPERLFLSQGVGDNLPYKVTDIVRAMLNWVFPADMIDVPDSSIRFYPSGNESGEDLLVDPLANIAETVQRFLRDYLGWFLIWNGNAGTRGQWQARSPNVPPYTPLATFTTLGPSGKVPTRPESYGTTAWAQGSSSAPSVTAPILRRGGRSTLRTYVKPPENNCVVVTGTGDFLPNKEGQYQLKQWLANPNSFDCFVDGSGNTVNTASPTLLDGSPNPDYIGYPVPLVIFDPSLNAGGQELIDLVCVRYYKFTCFALKCATFESPLVLVWDSADADLAAPRPLRYYDAVNVVDQGVTSTALVRSCNIRYTKDSHQYMSLEVVFPRDPQLI